MKDLLAIVVIGPTASGKTSLAHEIADYLGSKASCELVNLDAFQFYQKFNIGTAKPSREEILNYKYHLVDFLDPQESFDAQKYAKVAHETCADILQRGAFPICVGGSGLYLRAFLHGLDPFPPRDDKIRENIKNIYQEKGGDFIYSWLKEVDPIRAKELHPNDYMRLERALEIFLITEVPMSQLRTKTTILNKQSLHLNSFIIRKEPSPEYLREQIFKRTKQMINQGWIQEVEFLLKEYGEEFLKFQSGRAIGYQTIVEWLNSPTSLEDLCFRIGTLTWQYSRRQRVWNAKELAHAIVEDSFSKEQWCALENWFEKKE